VLYSIRSLITLCVKIAIICDPDSASTYLRGLLLLTLEQQHLGLRTSYLKEFNKRICCL
jgi:hypothetical protein